MSTWRFTITSPSDSPSCTDSITVLPHLHNSRLPHCPLRFRKGIPLRIGNSRFIKSIGIHTCITKPSLSLFIIDSVCFLRYRDRLAPAFLYHTAVLQKKLYEITLCMVFLGLVSMEPEANAVKVPIIKSSKIEMDKNETR